MTLNIEQTKEQVAVTDLENELAALENERDNYLTAVGKPHAKIPRRTLSEIRDSAEIIQARLNTARKHAATKQRRTPTEDEARALLEQAKANCGNTRKKVQAAADTVTKAIATLTATVNDHNTAIRDARTALTSAGIPAEGATLYDEPIDLTQGRIVYGDTTLTPYQDDMISHYLIAQAHPAHGWPRQPGGWDYIQSRIENRTHWA